MPLWSPQLFFASAGSSPLSVTWRSVTTSDAPGTAMTASGVSLGPSGDEFIIVSAQGGGGSANAAASCTVAGVAATKIEDSGSGGEPGVTMFKIARADVSGATTGDVIATWSSAPGRASIDTASVDGEVGDVTSTKKVTSGATLGNVSHGMAVSAGGIVIAAVIHNDGGTSWTNVTEGSDPSPFESTRSSFASADFATDQTVTVTATFASNSSSTGALFLGIAPG
jgi:hypothetical protein